MGNKKYEKMLLRVQCISNIPKFMTIHVLRDEILNKIVTKFQKNSFDIFFTIKG